MKLYLIERNVINLTLVTRQIDFVQQIFDSKIKWSGVTIILLPISFERRSVYFTYAGLNHTQSYHSSNQIIIHHKQMILMNQSHIRHIKH